MKIDFTKEQYENLCKAVYLGNFLANGPREDDYLDNIEEIEQYVYSFYKEFGVEDLIEEDEGKFYPTIEMEDEMDEPISFYDAESFWEMLADELGKRDFVEKYGQAAVKKMDFKERIEKESPFIDKYEKEFSRNGLANLFIKENKLK